MKLYFAGPLFSAAERDWNAALTGRLRAAGHEVFLPQDQEKGKDAAGIFATDVGGIDWSDALVAIMDGRTSRGSTRVEAFAPVMELLGRRDRPGAGQPGAQPTNWIVAPAGG